MVGLFQSERMHLMGNLVDIVSNTCYVSDECRLFWLDVFLDCSIHSCLVAIFADGQTASLGFIHDIDIVGFVEHDLATLGSLLIFGQLGTTTCFFLCCHTRLIWERDFRRQVQWQTNRVTNSFSRTKTQTCPSKIVTITYCTLL